MDKKIFKKINEEELKKIIKELAEKNPPSVIGKILRDQYGIPKTKIIYGKKISQYLKEMGIEVNEDLNNAQKKIEKIKDHLKKHHKDKKAKHKLQKAQSALNTLKNYLKKKNTQLVF